MDTFRAAILGKYVPVARFVGLEPYAILRRAQIDPRWLDDPDAPLALSSVVQVLEDSAALSGRDDLGILLAGTRAFSSLGPVSLLLEHENSIRRVIQAAIEYRPLLNEPLSIDIDEDGEAAHIRFRVPSNLESPQLMSHIVAVAAIVLIDASGGGWHPTSAHFRNAVPKWIATYARHFECPLGFDDSFNGLSCPALSLDTPVPSAEPILATYARRLLNLCPAAHNSGSVTHHVRDALQLLLPLGTPTLSKVSANLATPPRTVQQMLRKEGQTLEGLLRQLRRDLATRYLTQSRQALTQIAFNLGFASLSSFSRWFLGEFGVAPSVWRKQRMALPAADETAGALDPSSA